mmetsp:Transcript_63549/g.136612  ORF Transcript_63549/g.136612 Transcript_63549/m.136612 type:complete len:883 (+) Transcript_63549:81-2729(+)
MLFRNLWTLALPFLGRAFRSELASDVALAECPSSSSSSSSEATAFLQTGAAVLASSTADVPGQPSGRLYSVNSHRVGVGQGLALNLGTATLSCTSVASAEEGQEVKVHLQHRLPNQTELTIFCEVSSDGAILGPTNFQTVTRRATRLGDKLVLCPLPMLEIDGPVSLKVGTYSGHYSQSATVSYGPRLSVSFGERPYFASDTGELLVRTGPLPPGRGPFRILVELPDGNVLVNATTVAEARTVLPVSFVGLSPSLTVDAAVQLLAADGSSVANTTAQLLRVDGKPRGRSAVDHKRRALLVDGRPFFSIAWFSFYIFYGVDATISSLQDMARHGANSVMIYNLVGSDHPFFDDRGGPISMTETIKILDAAAASGIKVHVYLLDIVKELQKTNDWSKLEKVVRELRHHPAVMAWYVADDAAGSELPSVYSFIKSIDPYHLVTMAITGVQTVFTENYRRGADVIMLETYAQEASGAFDMMSATTRWPVEFMPAMTCGRAWTELEDNAVISKQVFRSQLYFSLIAGATGDMWFAYRNADGWNEPGMPLMAAAGEVAGELLELLPSLMSAGDYDPATAMPPVTVTVYLEDGSKAAVRNGVRARAFREADTGLVTLIVASNYNEPVKAVVDFGFGTQGVFDKKTDLVEAKVLFEGLATARRVKVNGGRLTEFLPSLGVQVYQMCTPGSCESSGGVELLHEAAQTSANLLQNPSFEVSRAYPGSPDDWDCNMIPLHHGSSGSTCYADAHVHLEGRRAGRFVTGSDVSSFRVRPGLSQPPRGNYSGSIWAMSDGPAELIVLRAHWDPVWKPFEEVARNETQLMRIALGGEWTQMSFEAELAPADQIYFQVSNPGVLWLDHAELRPTMPHKEELPSEPFSAIAARLLLQKT